MVTIFWCRSGRDMCPPGTGVTEGHDPSRRVEQAKRILWSAPPCPWEISRRQRRGRRIGLLISLVPGVSGGDCQISQVPFLWGVGLGVERGERGEVQEG